MLSAESLSAAVHPAPPNAQTGTEGWECHLGGLLRVSRSPLSAAAAALSDQVAGRPEREGRLWLSVEQQRVLGLPLSLRGGGVAPCRMYGHSRWYFARASSQSSRRPK